MVATLVAGAVGVESPPLPSPRGPYSAYVIEHLRRQAHPLEAPPSVEPGAWATADFQLALYVCYELHYRSFAGVEDAWEWHPDLLRFRARLESAFELAVDGLVCDGRDEPADDCVDPTNVERALWSLVDTPAGPSLSAYIADEGSLAEVRELAVHRSAYQLKEADPHTWAIPRLTGGAKAAMVEIQADEYGGGDEDRMHASLFAATMDELGLDSRYGAYLDHLPGPTLATVNLVSMFGLHRRLRGALVGHLAIFEMTSVVPMGRYSDALARLGFGTRARRFYDVHVEADAHHQHVAASGMAGRLALDEPHLAADIVYGARAVMAVEGHFTGAVLRCWAEGRTSLRRGIDPPAA